MPTRLRKLKITRVAVVDQGANQDADILLFKSLSPVGKEADEATCTDPDCDDADCPVHGTAGGGTTSVDKESIGSMGMHAEPDGDEMPPLDYTTRGRQYDLWECLWGKWECFCTTLYDIIGDADDDNIPHLPILVTSIGQFQADVEQLLADCGVIEKAAPLLAELTAVAKAGAVMAGHRRHRLRAAIAELQALLNEANPERPPNAEDDDKDAPAAGTPVAPESGAAAAVVAMRAPQPHRQAPPGGQGGARMAGPTMSDDRVAQQELELMRKRATDAEARVTALETQVATLEAQIADAKLTPEEQVAKYWAAQPEAVRKQHDIDELEKADLRKRLKEADEKGERADYIQKTAAYRGMGMTPDHWHVLKAIDAIPEEATRTEVLRLLKAAAEQLKTSALFTAIGSEGSVTSGSALDAEGEVLALAKRHADDKGVELHQAIDVVARANPELWHRYQVENRRKNRGDIR
jgi:hypothetical protein